MRSKAKKEKSIMHNREDCTCYLCMKLEDNYATYPYLEGHHVIYGKGHRLLSDKYGLIIYLCYRHHNDYFSPVAVHNNKTIREMTCIDAQYAFARKYPNLSFIDIFGINYITRDDISPVKRTNDAGITEIGNVLGDVDIWKRR